MKPYGKRSDGASIVPWKTGEMWDTTCVDTLAPSHRILAVRAVADDAKHRKREKHTHQESTHCLMPVAIETLGAIII